MDNNTGAWVPAAQVETQMEFLVPGFDLTQLELFKVFGK